LSENLQNENSIGFFSLQGNPVLLVSWMLYTTVFLVAITFLFIVDATQNFAIKDISAGTGNIVAALIYLCK